MGWAQDKKGLLIGVGLSLHVGLARGLTRPGGRLAFFGNWCYVNNF
jgi:hypothetical protein